MVWYDYIEKRSQGDKVYFHLSHGSGRNREEKWVERDALKKAILGKQVDVYNLQLDKAGRLVERNEADCEVAIRHREIIAKNMEQLYSKFKKFGSDVRYKGEFYRDLKYTGFIVGYMTYIDYNNIRMQIIFNYSHDDGYFVFINTEDGNCDEVLEGEPRVEDAMRFMESVIKNYLGLDLYDATSGSVNNLNFKAYLGSFQLDSSGQYLKPTVLYVGGSARAMMEFSKDIEDKAFFGGFVEGANDCCAIQLKSIKGMLPAILNMSKRYGSRVSVRGESQYSQSYLRELNNFYNKKACAIRSDGVLKL